MKTRNRIKGTVASIAVPLCWAPMLSFANPEPAVDACVKAFVTASLNSAQAVEVQTQGFSEPRPRSSENRRYEISLVATRKSSGKLLAKATCVVDRNNALLSLNGKAASSKVASDLPVALSSR